MSLDLDDRKTAMLAAMGVRWWGATLPLAQADAIAASGTVPPATAPYVNVSPKVDHLKPIPGSQMLPKAVPVPAVRVPARMVQISTRTSDDLVAIAQMDPTALAQAVGDCSACGLCAQRQGALVGMGHSPAALMVVGDAPTDADDRSQAPFSGPEGQLLDNMLRAIGASRNPMAAVANNPPAVTGIGVVFATHALKCRPPTGRAPSADDVVQCQPYLQRQVALVQPKVILAMGRLAVQSLLGSTEPLGRLRSRVHHAWGVRVIVTYELSYLLRNRAHKAQAWQDLCLALDTLDNLETSESVP